MIGMFTSGNLMVDEMATVNISGNVTPQAWYKMITRENGKPYLLAIALLSDIVYWYRPTEVRDEQTGCTIRWQKKFRGDYLQKSYQKYAEFFGESKRSVKAAIDRLIELKVINRFFEDIPSDKGTLHNVMFLSLNVEQLKRLTFPDEYPKAAQPEDADSEAEADGMEGDDDRNFGHSVQNEAEIAEGCGENEAENNEKGMVQNFAGHGTKFCTTPYKITDHVLQNFAGGPTEKCTTSYKEKDHVVQNNVGHGTSFVGTYTENTTEITSESTEENTTKNTAKITTQNTSSVVDLIEDIHPSIQAQKEQEKDPAIMQMMADIDTVKKNIQYDWVIANRSSYEVRTYKELFDLICDLLCVKTDFVNVGGQQIPYFRVREKMLSLQLDHLEYVQECMKKNLGRIGNIQAYLVKCLYNAPSTMDNFYDHAVKYDMYGGGVSTL